MAESVTVQGEGDITKMFVNNGQRALTVKIYGLDKPCGGAQSLQVRVRWGTSAEYLAEGSCIQANWYTGLYYDSNRSADPGAKSVDCPDFKFTYNATGHFHKVFIPRSCMGKAPDRINVRALGNNYSGSATGGSAGPTRRLARG
jgi:hypothetical protein